MHASVGIVQSTNAHTGVRHANITQSPLGQSYCIFVCLCIFLTTAEGIIERAALLSLEGGFTDAHKYINDPH